MKKINTLYQFEEQESKQRKESASGTVRAFGANCRKLATLGMLSDESKSKLEEVMKDVRNRFLGGEELF